MKKAIDLIVEHAEQIKLFEQMVKDGTMIVPSFLIHDDQWFELEYKNEESDKQKKKIELDIHPLVDVTKEC